MKTLTVLEFKDQFAGVIEWVKGGEEIAITSETNNEIIGHLQPETINKPKERKLGAAVR